MSKLAEAHIERIAEAIFNVDCVEDGVQWNDLDEESKRFVRKLAYAAVEANLTLVVAPKPLSWNFDPSGKRAVSSRDSISFHRQVHEVRLLPNGKYVSKSIPSYYDTFVEATNAIERMREDLIVDALTLYPTEDSTPAREEDAVDQFVQAMKTKLAMKRDEGYNGWNDASELSEAQMTRRLYNQVASVAQIDPVDVANLAMMIYLRRVQG